MIIGLLFGAAFGGTRLFWRNSDVDVERSYDRTQFEDVVRHGTDLRNLTLHPSFQGQEILTGELYKLKNDRFGPRLRYQRPGTTQPAQERPGDWSKFMLVASDTESKRPIYKTPVTAVEYFAALEKESPRLKSVLVYRTAWWEIPKVTIALYAAAGFVVIGVIWPTLINVLTGAGFGPQKKPKDEYDLSRFKSGPEPVAAVAGVSGTDQELHDLNAKMESNVADMLIGKTAIEEEDEEEARIIKQLETQSIDATEGATPEPEEDKEYKGEFYPVAKPGGKKPD
jgi:hypothetical protein